MAVDVTLKLSDQMSQPLQHITKALGTVISNMRQMQGLNNGAMRSAAAEVATASRQLDLMSTTSAKAAKSTKAVGEAAERSGQKTKGLGSAIGGLINAAGGLYLVQKGMDLVKSSVQSASDLAENTSKSDEVFKGNAKTVQNWAKNANKSFGLAKNQALQATSLFGDMGTSMGLSRKEAAKMSMSLAGLAGDLSSFHNVSLDQSMTALNGVFTGETESLKSLGVVMTQDNLQAFAASKGIEKKIQDMSQAEQVELRYQYVMEHTKNAHGDFARTSDQTANSLRTFEGAIDNLKIAIGQGLIPVITPVIQGLTKMIDAFTGLPSGVQKGIGAFALIGGTVGIAIAAFTKVSKTVKEFKEAIGGLKTAGNLGKLFDGIKLPPQALPIVGILAAIAAAAYLVYKNWDKIKPAVDNVTNALRPAIQVMMQVINTIRGVLTPVINAIKPVVVNAINAVKSAFSQGGAAFNALKVVANFAVNMIVVAINLLALHIRVSIAVIKVAIHAAVAVFQFFKSAVVAAINRVKSVINTLKSVVNSVKATWTSAWNGMKSAVSGFVSGVVGEIKGMFTKLKNIFTSGIKAIKKKWQDFKNMFKGGFDISLPHFAKGVSNFGGGPAVVGEHGPEIVTLPKGASVIPNRESKKLVRSQTVSSAPAGSHTTITVPKLADAIYVRSDGDIDAIANALVKKLELVAGDVA